ncbi:MAG: hypothetical protein ACK5IQ_08310 [Bacteroidales bacterium]
MKHILLYISTLSLVALNYSCSSIGNMSQYDSSTARRIEQTAEKIDELYLSVLQLSDEGDKKRAFSEYAKDYLDIEVDIRAIIFRLSSQYINNEDNGANKLLDYWLTCREQHKKEDSNITDKQIEIFHKQCIAFLEAIHFSEKTKE